MRKKIILSFVIGLITTVSIATLLFYWVPIPSRYVARLPQTIQDSLIPPQTPILPTLAPRATFEISSILSTPLPTFTLPPPIIAVTGSGGTSALSEPLPTSTPTIIPTSTPVPLLKSFRLGNFEHQFQTWNNCGPATTAMALSYFDFEVDQSTVAEILRPDPEDRNVSPNEIENYVNGQTEFEAISRSNGNLDIIRRLLSSGVPVMIELGIEPPGEFRWLDWYGHYLLVVAYDDDLEQLWVYDSWFGTSEVPMENANSKGRILTYTELDKQWQQFNYTYLVFHGPTQRTMIETIIGAELDDSVMWNGSLERAKNDVIENDSNAFAWFNLGTILNAQENYEAAAAAFDQALAQELPWRMLWYQFGPYEAYYQVGRFEDVILLADITLKNRPYLEESYFYRGMAKIALGNAEGGRLDLAKAESLNPQNFLSLQSRFQAKN